MKKLYILFIPLLLAVFSCDKSEENSVRDEFIEIYATADCTEPLDRTFISVKGGTDTYYVRSNVDFQVKWQDSGERWGSVSDPIKVSEDIWKFTVTAAPLSERTLVSGEGLYTRRYGVVLFSASSRYLGKFFKVEQGLDNRLICDFSWLTGSAEPNATHKDLLYSRWTLAQKNQGFTSTVLDGQEEAWVYSKDGYVKLGSDEALGADLITPRISDFMNDTLLVVSFKAVAHNGDLLPDFGGGTEPLVPLSFRKRDISHVDNNKLTVSVTGGGYIRDFLSSGGTSINIEGIPTYNQESERYPSDIFDGARFLVFIQGTDQNPLTVNTAIHFMAGDQSGQTMEKCNRIYIDDICIYRASDLWDEDIFPLNGRSGKDTVL